MTNREFSDNFTTLLNSFSSSPEFGKQEAAQDIVLSEYEKSVFLSLAEEDVVKSYFDSTLNPQQQGFDDTPRRQVDYGSLIKVVDITPVNFVASSQTNSADSGTVVNASIESSGGTSSGMRYISGLTPAANYVKTYNWTKELSYTEYVSKTHNPGSRGVEATKILFNKDGGTQYLMCPVYRMGSNIISYECSADWINIAVTAAAGRFPTNIGTLVCEPNTTCENRTAKISVSIYDGNWTKVTVFREIEIVQMGGDNKSHYLSNLLTIHLQGETSPRYLLHCLSRATTGSDLEYGYVWTDTTNKIYISFSDGKSVSEHYSNGDITFEFKSDKYYCDTYPTQTSYLKGLFYVDNPSTDAPTFFRVLVKEDGLVVAVDENTSSSYNRGCLSIHINNNGDTADYDVLVLQDYADVSTANAYSTGKIVVNYDITGGSETIYYGGAPSVEEFASWRWAGYCVLPMEAELPDWVSVTINNTNPACTMRIPVTVSCDYNPSALVRHCSIPLFIWTRYGINGEASGTIKPKIVRLEIVQAGYDQGTDIRQHYIQSVYPAELTFESTINEAETSGTKTQKIYLELAPNVTGVRSYPDNNSWFDVKRFNSADNTIEVELTEDNPNEIDRFGIISLVAFDQYNFSSNFDVSVKQLKKVRKLGPIPFVNVNPTTITFDSGGGTFTFANVNLEPEDETAPESDYVRWWGGENPEIAYNKDYPLESWVDIGYTLNGYYVTCAPLTDPLVTTRSGKIRFISQRINGVQKEIVDVTVTQTRSPHTPTITVEPLATEDCTGVGFGSDGGEILLSVTLQYADDFSIEGLDVDSFPSETFSVDKLGDKIKISCTQYAGDMEGVFYVTARNNDAEAEPVAVYLIQQAAYADIPEGYYIVEYEAPALSLTAYPTNILLPYAKGTTKVINVAFVQTADSGLPYINDDDPPAWINMSFNTGHTQLSISAQNNGTTAQRTYYLPIKIEDVVSGTSKSVTITVKQDSCPSFAPYTNEFLFQAVEENWTEIPFRFGGANNDYPSIDCPSWLKVEYTNSVLRIKPEDNPGVQREADVNISIHNSSNEYAFATIHVTQLPYIQGETITPNDPDYPDTGSQGGNDSGDNTGGDPGGGNYDDDSIPEGGVFDDRSLLFRLPRRVVNNVAKKGTTDVLFILNEKLLVKTGTAADSFTIRPMSFTEYDRIMSNTYAYPMKRQSWRLFQNQNTGFDIFSEIIPPNGSYNCDSYVYRLRYVRRPKPIILENLPDGLSIDGYSSEMSCELNPILHMDILARAVQFALSARGLNVKPSEK